MRAKKSLGQNFLTAKRHPLQLVQSASVVSSDVIVEIGPGKGIITEILLEKAKKVIAVEKDRELIEFLNKKFFESVRSGKLKLIHGDILHFKPEDYGLKSSSYKLIGSIPYYLTSQLLRYFLSHVLQPKTIALIIQKEVARRITEDEKESILSLSVKVYGKPHYVKTIKSREFSPQPKVDSAIISIDEISKKFFKNIDEKSFFELIKLGFSSKRKKLATNLKKVCHSRNPKIREAKIEMSCKEIFEKIGISPDIRAERLTLKDWEKLYKVLYSNISS